MIVFPSTNSGDPKEKIITEYNICNIVNRLVNRDAFVISAVKSDSTGSELSISFNIQGYIFSTNNLWGEENLPAGVNKETAVYALLNVTQATGDNWPYWNTYAGLEFKKDKPKSGVYLQLWDSETQDVPRDSWVKFDNGAVYIDDGDLGD